MRRTRDGGNSFGPIRAHSGVFREMQMLVRLARLQDSDPKLYDRVMEERLTRDTDESRRRFLKGAAGVAAGALGLEMIESFAKKAHGQTGQRKLKVAIIGGGIAGLNCAWQLRNFFNQARNPAAATALARAGVSLDVTIYEARPNRTGGRMLSSRHDVARGMICELGAEFIDSSNEDMFWLVQDPELGEVCQRHFGHPLAMLDCGQDHKANHLIPQNINVKGETIRFEQVKEGLREIAGTPAFRLRAINNRCDQIKQASRGALSCGGTGSIAANNFGQLNSIATGTVPTDIDGQIRAIDHMNVRQVLDTDLKTKDGKPLDREGWLYRYLEAAYTTEYGLPLEEQSA
ncbi:MAG TPA: FAD/NAD(P)-binding protein, partial [Bdellovibrionota bacterium]|nr:FAD/NAD(P)-binding protein [Bdellovibrionota bacterium]